MLASLYHLAIAVRGVLAYPSWSRNPGFGTSTG